MNYSVKLSHPNTP